MRLLLLSFYYPPDLSAGSFRASALVKALLEADPALEIVLVTTIPNRYRSYAAQAPALETQGRLTIHRVQLPAHRNGFIDQMLTYGVYAQAVWKVARQGSFDFIMATSGRLMTAALAATLSRWLRRPLYLDIRDIFVETIGDVLPTGLSLVSGPVFSLLERYTISQASAVNLVSGGFLPYFEPRYPRQHFETFTNGVDDDFITPARAGVASAGRPLRITYAGNMGDSQGLEIILPELAARLAGRATFRIIGDGGGRARLEREIAARGLANVTIEPPVARDRLVEIYDEADVLFLHLNDRDAFTRVLPSKLFEYAATGKPILAGVTGYCASFMRSEVTNASVFPPCQPAEAVTALETLSLLPAPRTDFVAKYRRTTLMAAFAQKILTVGRARHSRSD
ncbi:MAG: glycosyltransferase family 4 protein [Devosia indica]